MKATILSKRPLFVFKPYAIFLVSVILGLVLTMCWVQASVRAAAEASPREALPASPFLLKDIEPGTGDSYPSGFTPFKGSIFFRASDSAHGYELWISDGSITGTILFKDMLPGSQGSSPMDFLVVDDTLFFSAQDEIGDRWLWKSDGTPSGTVQIPGAKTTCEDMMPCNGLINIEGIIYFYGGDPDHGYELWKTDGTPEGTMMVKDIRPGPENSLMVRLLNSNGTLYFFADDGTHGGELWKSDGTISETTLVKDINPGSTSSVDLWYGSGITVINNELYFKADDGIHGGELWKSDGTDAHTQFVRDIYPGQSGSNVVYLTPYNRELLFYADDGTHGLELWKSDGTAFGTTLLKDIRPGSEGKQGYCLTCQMGPIYHGHLYFEANSETALQLWRTDGTEAGTVSVMDLTSDTSAWLGGRISLNNLLYVHRYVSEQYGLWTSDGANPPTLINSDIRPWWHEGLQPEQIIEQTINGKFLFLAFSQEHGYELWAIPVTTYSSLELSLFSEDVLKPGDLVTYTIGFKNTGTTHATQVILTDTLSASLHDIQYVSSGAAITLLLTSPYVWQVADLAPLDGGVITISAVLNTDLANGDLITNSSQLSAQMSDGVFLNYQAAKQSVIADIPPVISAINDAYAIINQTAIPITFTIDDEDTPLAELTVTAASSNTALIPDEHIAISGNGLTRTVTLVPEADQIGSAAITITVRDHSSSTFETFNVYVEPHHVYLPFVKKPSFIPPGIYAINQCVESDLYIRGTYAGLLKECVPDVEVREDGQMQFNYTWNVDLVDSIPSIIKYSDAENINMYITDNLSNRYDHVGVGGAAGGTTTLYDNATVGGWFLFAPAKYSATTFTFHNDDQGTSIVNIRLVP